MKYDDELSLEELDQVTAGLPDLSKLEENNQQRSSGTSKFEKPLVFGNEHEISRRETILEEGKEAVESLPQGELFEDDLDAIISGRTK